MNNTNKQWIAGKQMEVTPEQKYATISSLDFGELIETAKFFGSRRCPLYHNRTSTTDFTFTNFTEYGNDGKWRFFDGAFRGEGDDDYLAMNPDRDIYVMKPVKKKPIALDFMGTLNDPNAKNLIWTAIQNAILKENTRALEESGMNKEQIAHFREYIETEECSPMQFRDYALSQEGIKQIIGRYASIGALNGELGVGCRIYGEVISFLTIAKALGHPVEVFSTLKAPEGLPSLQEIMLQKYELPEEYKLFLNCFGERCETAADLVSEVVVNKKKKSEPGQAVLEETERKGLHLYVDDEICVIEDTVNTFASQEETTLPMLCRIEREGIKDPGYNIPESHKGIGDIVVARYLMDASLLEVLYK